MSRDAQAAKIANALKGSVCTRCSGHGWEDFRRWMVCPKCDGLGTVGDLSESAKTDSSLIEPAPRRLDTTCEAYGTGSFYLCRFCGKATDQACVCSCPEATAEHEAIIERQRTEWFVASGRSRLRCDECGKEPACLFHTTPDGMTFCDGCKGRIDRSLPTYPLYIAKLLGILGVFVVVFLLMLALSQ